MSSHYFRDHLTLHRGPWSATIDVDQWAYEHGVKLQFIASGKPIQNTYIESFNAWRREECFNERVFLSLDYARSKIGRWRITYNCERPRRAWATSPRGVRSKESDELGRRAHRLASSGPATGRRGATRSGLGSKT